jgi:ribosomal protein S18 acetylase RimI-like enzyme
MKMCRLIPMLPVSSMPASVDFYQQLGFSVERRNDDWRWAMLRFGECRVMLDESINAHPAAPRSCVIYLYPDDIAQYHKQVRSNGLLVPDLEVTFYGMSEFRIEDPDGNRLWVGQDASKPAPPFGTQGVMSRDPIALHTGDAPEIEAFLAERIYEFNSNATGYFDGESFSGAQRDAAGAIRAGIYGYTWGGCCYVSYLWVDESGRRHGLGRALLLAAEEHARLRRCTVLFVATHSFQAPGFYERMGYERQSFVRDHPVGHSSGIYAKHLQQSDA